MQINLATKTSRSLTLSLLAAALLAGLGMTWLTQITRADKQAGRPKPWAATQSLSTHSEPAYYSSAFSQINPFNTRILHFDVRENGTKFTPDETPAFPDGLPAYGAEFITEGYIYPFGTLNGTNGLKPDGSPEFPDKVLGTWICRGWHIGNGAHTTTGPWIVTHQLFSFGTQPGRETIVTDGYELPEANVPILRAITGGTGQYALARGETIQTQLGFDPATGVSVRFELRMQVR